MPVGDVVEAADSSLGQQERHGQQMDGRVAPAAGVDAPAARQRRPVGAEGLRPPEVEARDLPRGPKPARPRRAAAAANRGGGGEGAGWLEGAGWSVTGG